MSNNTPPSTGRKRVNELKKELLKSALNYISGYIQEDKDFRYDLIEEHLADETMTDQDRYDLVNEVVEEIGIRLEEVAKRIKE